MVPVKRTVARVANLIRKASARLTLFGESVWPGVKNDLFVAHYSIYRFFSSFTDNKRVLDAGCGAGYGAHYLSTHGALHVLGVDIDRRSIRYAIRHYESEHATLSFIVGDCQSLDIKDTTFDVVVSSNVLEHLEEPGSFLGNVRRHLAEEGCVVLALPPILSKSDLDRHSDLHYHRANLTVDEWLGLFDESGWQTIPYRHIYRGPEELDFSSPLPSKVATDDFHFEPTTRDGLYASPSITAVYVLRSKTLAKTT